jgi:pantothenate synthetase
MEILVVTIFVNPLQFSPDGKDLQEYPRTLDNDLTLLKGGIYLAI